MNPFYYLVLSAALFTIGAVGVLVRRNAIVDSGSTLDLGHIIDPLAPLGRIPRPRV